MMNKRNYQRELDALLTEIEKEHKIPRLFLHSCCAPCSSHCIEYLSDYFHITVFYYNPNISAEEEYRKRVEEQKRFISEFPAKYKVSFIEGDYDTKEFYDIAKGYEQCREGGERCFRCYELRLRKTCETAKAGGFDYFTTTLSISPMKNAVKLNEIGGRLAEEYGIPYLYSDFKKRDGYKRSTVISAEYGMYRQDYCGCVFSKREREEQKRERAAQESEQTVQE